MLGVIIMHVVALSLRSGVGRVWYVLNIDVSFAFIVVPIFL